MLSRLPLENKDSNNQMSVFNIQQLETLPVTQVHLRNHTRRDPVLSKVLNYSKKGWPTVVEEVLKPYKSRENEIMVQRECLLWGTRVIVPLKLRKQVLEELHAGHQGMSRMKSLARCHIWWPKIDQEIEQMCRSCKPCLEGKSCPGKAPIHPWIWPTRPFQRVHVDFAGPFQGSMFLLLLDAHSKWPEIYQMKSTTVQKTITILKHIFATHGIPEQLVTDNGSQFTSREFMKFMTNNGIKHIKTSPYHPSSNGAVERLVQSFKKAMKASYRENKTVG